MTQSLYGTKLQQVNMWIPSEWHVGKKRLTFIQLLVKVVNFKTGHTAYKKVKNTCTYKCFEDC